VIVANGNFPFAKKTFENPYFHIKLCLTNTCDANFRSLSPSVFSLSSPTHTFLNDACNATYTYYIGLLSYAPVFGCNASLPVQWRSQPKNLGGQNV